MSVPCLTCHIARTFTNIPNCKIFPCVLERIYQIKTSQGQFTQYILQEYIFYSPDDDVEHRNLLALLTTGFIDLQIESRRE